MPKKKSYITATDQFCGAGGSTQGAKASGAEVMLAMNHWKLATETYATNNQDTMIDCTDISACDPRRYPSTDILITSPECTNHSLAKGVKIVKKQMDMFSSGKIDPAAERSRATMWDVPRFAEYHNYNAIIVENVVDARKWIMFDAWLQAMHLLGYNHKCCYHNSMHHHPTPQSRDRMYVVFWKKGNKTPDLNFMPEGWCYKCERNVFAIQSWKKDQKSFKYKTGYEYCCPTCSTITEPYYYAAFNCIDWSDKGQRIGDRKKPLSPNSKKRILYGLEKFGPQPIQIQTVNGGEHEHRSRPMFGPSFTHTTLQSQGMLVPPFIINDQHSTGIGFRVKGMHEFVQGVTTDPHFKIVMPPLIIKGEHSQQEGYVKSVKDAFQTQNTRQTFSILVPPAFVVENKKTSTARKVINRIGCITTNTYQGILTNDSWNSFITHYYNGSDCVKHITDTVGTATANDRMALLQYQKPEYEDCYYRMLKHPEIQAAMAFESDYIVLGTGKEKVRQLGNAVTPPAMKWLTKQVIESLK